MENSQQEVTNTQAKHNLEEVRFALTFLNHSLHLSLLHANKEEPPPMEGTLEGMGVFFSWIDEKLDQVLS